MECIWKKQQNLYLIWELSNGRSFSDNTYDNNSFCDNSDTRTGEPIPILHRIKAGQSIREEGPKAHQVKAGTPTMGGIMIILAVIITCVTIGHGLNADMGILLLSFVLCGLIGFCDDFIKVVKKRNLGLTALQKLIFQIIIAIIIAVYQAKVSVYGTSVYIPIWKNYIDFGWFYIPFIAFVLVAAVNAVNLTDGLDGLASGCTAIVALFFAISRQCYGMHESYCIYGGGSRRMHRIPSFQSLPCKGIHGRHRLAGSGRSSCDCGCHDEYRNDTAARRRYIRRRSTVCNNTGSKL